MTYLLPTSQFVLVCRLPSHVGLTVGSLKYCACVHKNKHAWIISTTHNLVLSALLFQLQARTQCLTYYFPQAAPKTPKRLDATALRADRSEIPIPYLRVGKRDAEVDAPVMYDMGPDVRYGRASQPSSHRTLTIRSKREKRDRGVE